jgi:hypothetical protein
MRSAIVLNPNYTRGKESYVPILKDIKVSQADIDEMNWSESQWDNLKSFIQKIQSQTQTEFENDLEKINDDLREKLQQRQEMAEVLFPLTINSDN